ncbi:MAG: hypothetical protein Q7K39_04835, partial [Candidatus Magasanikbacteria bacterium]|nr:hypothetical protein [Candidatus Magasanikbacteria bacterium]
QRTLRGMISSNHMNTQVIFKIDKKLKRQAMAKAQDEGLAFAYVLKLATKAFVAGNLTVGLVGSEKFNTTAGKEITGALRDIAIGKNVSPRFSSAQAAASYLRA